ncbi:tripartite tricarboxylate transporter TctB family protein [Vreelandella maris]|uniref:Tripartite tricarboxylate transporter TctB family protein n=2 Tax=Vreelandella TaxID=3137766 RepID=A0A7Y6V7Q0_9GAMM|nr:tripartite tricarboxylate transporter TctB family protein [Halomonas maris]NVF13514.1 tripartite tricarboxylate transporter TctB family protein [Halomonas maris]
MLNRSSQTFGECCAGGVVAALGLLIVMEAQGFPTLPGQRYGAALFPLIIGFAMIVGGIWLALTNLRPVMQRFTTPRPVKLKAAALSFHRLFLPVWLVIGYLLLADTLGALLTLALLVAVLMLLSGVRPWLALVMALLTAAAIWGAFVYMLRVPLPLGTVFNG